MTTNDAEASARAVWAAMSKLVQDDERRREVSEAVGLPLARIRALRRIAARPRSLGALAAALGIDPPNCTAVVDDLERRGLVERQPHPTDRRIKLVVTTAKGTRLAMKAQAIMDVPPDALLQLAPADLSLLADVLARLHLVEEGR